jgi:hypothetical protein
VLLYYVEQAQARRNWKTVRRIAVPLLSLRILPFATRTSDSARVQTEQTRTKIHHAQYDQRAPNRTIQIIVQRDWHKLLYDHFCAFEQHRPMKINRLGSSLSALPVSLRQYNCQFFDMILLSKRRSLIPLSLAITPEAGRAGRS